MCECLCNWQVEELCKVFQTQPASLQFSGSSGLLLQHFAFSSCSQPVDQRKYKEITSCNNEKVSRTVNNTLYMETRFVVTFITVALTKSHIPSHDIFRIKADECLKEKVRVMYSYSIFYTCCIWLRIASSCFPGLNFRYLFYFF